MMESVCLDKFTVDTDLLPASENMNEQNMKIIRMKVKRI